MSENKLKLLEEYLSTGFTPSEVVKLKAHCLVLEAALSESQRREKAAIKDLEQLAKDTGDSCGYCKKCPCSPQYSQCQGFEWRGPCDGEKK